MSPQVVEMSACVAGSHPTVTLEVSEATGSGLSQAGTRRKGLKLPAMQHCLAAALEPGLSCWAKQEWHCLLKRNLNQPLVNAVTLLFAQIDCH